MKRAVKRLVRRLFRVASSETPADARKPPRPDKKKVWRITQRAPQGEWVDPVEAASATLDRSPQHGSPRSWNASSLDLLHGADVVEFSQDTMPSAFYDQDFESHGPKPPKKRS